jgi:hypothetical protein
MLRIIRQKAKIIVWNNAGNDAEVKDTTSFLVPVVHSAIIIYSFRMIEDWALPVVPSTDMGSFKTKKLMSLLEMEVEWSHGQSSRPRYWDNCGDKGNGKGDMAVGKGTGRAGRPPLTGK